MVDIIINDQLAVVCLPELVNLLVQTIIPNLAPGYKIETKQHEEIKEAK